MMLWMIQAGFRLPHNDATNAFKAYSKFALSRECGRYLMAVARLWMPRRVGQHHRASA